MRCDSGFVVAAAENCRSLVPLRTRPEQVHSVLDSVRMNSSKNLCKNLKIFNESHQKHYVPEEVSLVSRHCARTQQKKEKTDEWNAHKKSETASFEIDF